MSGDVWTLQTWLPGDPPEGYGYGYPSQESAERNGREFQHSGKDAVRWQVVSPMGVVVASWRQL